MRKISLTPSERRHLSAFAAAEGLDRAGEVERQFIAGEISRDEFRWLIGANVASDAPTRKSRGDYAYAVKYDHGFGVRVNTDRLHNCRTHNTHSNTSGTNAARQVNEVGERVNDCKSHSAAPAEITHFSRVHSARGGQPVTGVSFQT